MSKPFVVSLNEKCFDGRVLFFIVDKAAFAALVSPEEAETNRLNELAPSIVDELYRDEPIDHGYKFFYAFV